MKNYENYEKKLCSACYSTVNIIYCISTVDFIWPILNPSDQKSKYVKETQQKNTPNVGGGYAAKVASKKSAKM